MQAHPTPETIRIGISMKTEISSERSMAAMQRNFSKLNAKGGIQSDCEYFAEGVDFILNGSSKNNEEEIERLVKLFFTRYQGLLIPGNNDNINPQFYTPSPTPIDYSIANNRRSALEIALVREALKRSVPVLGICGGHQIINVALGGRIIDRFKAQGTPPETIEAAKSQSRMIPPLGTERIAVKENTKLATMMKQPHEKRAKKKKPDLKTKQHFHLFKEGIVTSEYTAHLEAIDPTQLHPIIIVSALDATGVIKAIELKGHPLVIGTQFHPEYFSPGTKSDNAIFKNFIKVCQKVYSQKRAKAEVHAELKTTIKP